MPDNKFLDALALLDPSLLSYVRNSSLPEPANQYGFPQPGEQSPTPVSTTNKYYFADDTKWKAILEYGDFDDIVIGTGFCGLAYIDKALKLNPKRRILVLERGVLWLMTHFQNLDLPFNLLLNNASETYPWSLKSRTFHDDIKFVHGSFPFFGGRSPFWSAFSPRPPLKLLRDFPPSMVATAKEEQFWKECRELLHVVEPSQLYDGEYQALQEYIEVQFKDALDNGKIRTADYGEPADLAVGKSTGLSKVVFEKFSTPGPLLKIFERQRQLAKEGKGSPLTIVTDVTVERFNVDDLDPAKRADVLYTSRGALSFPRKKKPNVILATGAMPACTIVLNSIEEQQERAGSRLSGHFLTHVNARFPVPPTLKQKLEEEREERAKERKERDEKRRRRLARRPDGPSRPADDDEEKEALEIAAYYLAGEDPITKLQYHADITVIHSPHPEEQKEDAARLCPDFFSTPTAAQFQGSEDHVIVACVMLCEISEKYQGDGDVQNKDDTRNRIIFAKERADKTTNIDLLLTLSDDDKKLRTTAFWATVDCINAMAGEMDSKVEYWRDNGDGTGKWLKSHILGENGENFQMPGIVHESSTLYMDDRLPTHPKLEPENPNLAPRTPHPSVDSNYRVYGCGNVYATGSALFPTSGSWNPTLTMCGYTQDLAIKLHKLEVFRQVFALSVASTLVNDLTGTAENLRKVLDSGVNSTLSNINIDWRVEWGPAVWKEQVDDKTTGIVNSWYVAYHPQLRYADGTLHPTYVIAVTGTPLLDSIDSVADFYDWMQGGLRKMPARKTPKSSNEASRPCVSLATARAVHTLLNTPAVDLEEGKSLLDFITDLDKTASPRFIFTGHGFGGGIAISLALALVWPKSGEDQSILSKNHVLTYPSGAPSPGNTSFNVWFEQLFPSRRLDKLDSYKGWNLNLVNKLDVVPQAWCIDRNLSPEQNLFNISSIYASPLPEKDASLAITAMRASSQKSRVQYKPLPSQYFSGIPASTAPMDHQEAMKNLVSQHIQAYIDEIRIDALLRSATPLDGMRKKVQAETLRFFPVISDLA